MMKNTKSLWLIIIPAMYWAPGAFADYKTDIGYTALQSLLGVNIPTGANVNVIQGEASLVGVADSAYPIYSPDTTNSQIAFKNLTFPVAPSTSPSGHATSVGSLFYGSDSIAYGISNITSYETNNWLSSIKTTNASAPVNGSRIANQSWIGNGNTPAETGIILRLTDRQVQHN